MLHDSRNKYILAITYSICLTLCCMMQETIDKYRSVRCDTYSLSHVEVHLLIVMDNFHSAAAQNV